MIQTVCQLGKRIRCAARHWQSIVRKHDALVGLADAVADTLQHPRYIRLRRKMIESSSTTRDEASTCSVSSAGT